MSARLTSSFWTAALVRRVFAEGAMAAVARRGAEEAGAIFVLVDRLDGTADLYAPAPQTAFAETEEASGGRLFERRLAGVPVSEAEAALAREVRFDPDLWVIGIDDRAGRAFLDVAAG